MENVRVRIAPSPTGPLHIGTARTALFNWLFAKKHRGSFVLRIEDTDIERSDPRYGKDILEGMRWLGIEADENPEKGGPFGPYRQSQRIPIYQKYLEKLLEEGRTFYCFHTEEELQREKEEQMKNKEVIRHICSYRDSHLNLLDKPSIIRLKVEKKDITFNDIIRGPITFNTETIGDISLAKNLTTPLYNFAVVIDDLGMKISHVIRGEDHIPNTPKQLLIYEAVGAEPPKFAHLPLILGPDRAKLSKRHGAQSLLDYREQGFLPEAMVNFLALLGWNPGTPQEKFSREELAEVFSLERVQKSGAIFDIKKLKWLNSLFIRELSTEKLTEMIQPFLEKAGLAVRVGETVKAKDGRIIDQKFIERTCEVIQERLETLQDAVEQSDYFFAVPSAIPQNLFHWKDATASETKNVLDLAREITMNIEPSQWNKDTLVSLFLAEADRFGKEIRPKSTDKGWFLWPLRVALSGKRASAGPMEIMEVIGKDETIRRIERALGGF